MIIYKIRSIFLTNSDVCNFGVAINVTQPGALKQDKPQILTSMFNLMVSINRKKKGNTMINFVYYFYSKYSFKEESTIIFSFGCYLQKLSNYPTSSTWETEQTNGAQMKETR